MHFRLWGKCRTREKEKWKRRGQPPRQTGSKDTPVRTFDSAGFIGRHGQYPVSSLNITSLDLPCHTEAWTLVCVENINMDKEKWKGKILFQSMRQWLLPLNTSETHSLKGLSIDLWGGLKASVEERGKKQKTKKKEEIGEKRECLVHIMGNLMTSVCESFSLVLDE